MSELQTKIEEIIRRLVWERDDDFGAEAAAKEILAIPEIAEALDASARDRKLAADFRKANLGHSITVHRD